MNNELLTFIAVCIGLIAFSISITSAIKYTEYFLDHKDRQYKRKYEQLKEQYETMKLFNKLRYENEQKYKEKTNE